MAVNEAMIIEGVQGLKLAGDENGLIRRFGVLLNNTHVNYFNEFSHDFTEAIVKSHGENFREIAEHLLIHAAQDCGNNTFFGIMTSDEWKGLVEPMIENEEDKIKALVAVENALGWAKVELTELVPGEKLVLRARGGYEALGHIDSYGKARRPFCHMLNGVNAAFMDLVYGPGIGPENLGTFASVETKCQATGDDYCEFVATRR